MREVVFENNLGREKENLHVKVVELSYEINETKLSISFYSYRASKTSIASIETQKMRNYLSDELSRDGT